MYKEDTVDINVYATTHKDVSLESILMELSIKVRRYDSRIYSIILSGDFNAPMGEYTGDRVINNRGKTLLKWIDDHNLILLNAVHAR